MLVGRITDDFKMNESKNGKQYASNTLAVSRAYKNEEGIYETDFIPFNVYGPIADSACEYCRKGDVIGLKGSLNVYDNKLSLNTERITFISSKSKKDEKTEEKDIKM